MKSRRIMTPYFSDLHCHASLFGYNRLFPDTWYEKYFPVFPAQGDFTQMARGNVRVVMASLYPIEQGFLTMRTFHEGTGDITDFLAKIVVDIPKQRADEIQDYDHEYFEDLLHEIRFVGESASPVTHKVYINPLKWKEFRYKIVGDFEELKTLLEIDQDLRPGISARDTIAVVLTIEGAHSLGVGQRNTLLQNDNDLKSKLKENIARLKNLGPPGREGDWCPFFISLDHHFWNQLGGHAVSLWKVIRKVLDQRQGINSDITELGTFVVEQLLDTTGGKRRILIDTAHMSIKVRRWYYQYLNDRGGNIPVFVSHTGVNGKATMAEAEMHGSPESIHDIADKLYQRSDQFNPWDVFLSDEEIMIIHRSAGLIGLNLDQRIGMGKGKLDDIKKRARFRTIQKSREIWIEPFVDEILHIALHIFEQTGEKAKIWDNISIGSDFNGMITPLPPFRTAGKFPALQKYLYRELKRRSAAGTILTGLSDADIQEITDKIMWKNNLRFLEKYFHR